jgi:hypothetical protein
VGLWGWLTEKRRLRQLADAPWAALEKHEKKVNTAWTPEQKKAYRDDRGLQAADAKAHRAHLDAEAQFDEADRRMSTSMAREGAQMAIEAWTIRAVARGDAVAHAKISVQSCRKRAVSKAEAEPRRS